MNTTQLHYFMTLSQTLNYSTAAQQLFITQPTLSRSIMALEDEIGTKLFFRENGNVSLTPAGKLMQEELKPLSARYETMLQHLRNRGRGLTGELTIAISNEQQFPERLIQSVRGFMHTYPNIGVQFRRVDMGMMTAALQEGLVDLVVGLAFGGDAKKAVYVTNGLLHTRILARKGCIVYVPAGRVKPRTEAIVGAAVLNSLRRYNFTKAFMGANGISIERGFMTPTIEEAELKAAAIQSSLESWFLADESKFNKICAAGICDLGQANIITNRLPDVRYAEKTLVKESDRE